MNHNTHTGEIRTEPADPLDRLLSDYFQAQMRTPWPPAPATTQSEPSVLVAERAVPRVSTRDGGRSSRSTLLVAAALLFGSCWYLSNGFAPGNANSTRPAPVTGNPMLGGASAGKPAVLEEIRKDKAGQGNGTGKLPKIELP